MICFPFIIAYMYVVEGVTSHNPYRDLDNHDLNQKIILRNGCITNREMST